jgi:hypothetical protein
MDAKEFIDAVCKPKNIVDWVHGQTELLKPVVWWLRRGRRFELELIV